jgi:hypothetical protein
LIVKGGEKVAESLDMNVLDNGAEIIINESIRQRIKIDDRSDADQQYNGPQVICACLGNYFIFHGEHSWWNPDNDCIQVPYCGSDVVSKPLWGSFCGLLLKALNKVARKILNCSRV